MNNEQLLKREQLAKQICAQLNNFVDLKNILSTIISQLKEITGCQAVSIRLQENDDYPYFVSDGFSSSFIEKENSLRPTNVIKLKNQKAQLDCLCGNVIRGEVDKSQTYYTKKGSYYTNGSTDAINLLQKNEKNNNFRNFCNACGYESIGLFPIKAREENIGLIQLNDKRKNMFTNDLVEFIEMVGEQIGVAIENALLYEKLKERNVELQRTVDELNNAHDHLLEAKKMSTLADLVTGLNHEISQPVTYAIGLLENVIKSTKDLSNAGNSLHVEINRLVSNEKEIYNNLNVVKNLIKSFRGIAFDQFQETRHLINLRNFFNDAIRVIKPSLKNKDIGFEIECNEFAEIMSFGGVLSQVLIIFIRNAYNHAFKVKNSGIIKLGCSLSDDDFLEIRFSDNGCGIDENIKHKIFEPFFTTDKKNHSGLGLYTASNLVENKLKGKILLEKTSPTGTTFVIRIPL